MPVFQLFVSRPCTGTSTVTCCTASPFDSPPLVRLVVYYRHQVQVRVLVLTVQLTKGNKGSVSPPSTVEIWAAAFTTLRRGTPSSRTFSPLLRYRRVRLSWNFSPARSAPIQMARPHDTCCGGTSVTGSAAKVPGGTRGQGSSPMPLVKSTVLRAVCSFEAQSRKFPHPCHWHSIGYDALWLQLPGVAESFKRHAGQILACAAVGCTHVHHGIFIQPRFAQFGYRDALSKASMTCLGTELLCLYRIVPY